FMKKFIVLAMACVAGFAGCKTAGQVQTPSSGSAVMQNSAAVPRENPYMKMIDQSVYTPFVSEQMGPLPEHIVVKVAQWGILDGYDVVGYAEIAGDTIQDRIRLAEKYARAFGGEIIMAKGITTREQLKSTYRDRATQGFLIWRKKPVSDVSSQITVIDPTGKKIEEQAAATVEKKQDDSVLQDLTEDSGAAPKVYLQYGNLPRLTYNKLLGNAPESKAQDFRGSSYALKLFKVPDDLGIEVKGEQKMAMLATRSGENKLFLLVPSDRVEWVQGFIKNDKVMEFVYRPVGLYKEKYPVLQFVDEMK
ncbi:MAG: hypothetical protein ACRCUT_04995, partial [Spirochaetota bacterium]